MCAATRNKIIKYLNFIREKWLFYKCLHFKVNVGRCVGSNSIFTKIVTDILLCLDYTGKGLLLFIFSFHVPAGVEITKKSKTPNGETAISICRFHIIKNLISHSRQRYLFLINTYSSRERTGISFSGICWWSWWEFPLNDGTRNKVNLKTKIAHLFFFQLSNSIPFFFSARLAISLGFIMGI